MSKVVVVGGGLAGLTAAIEAHANGAHVILLEKTASLGGNSAKATSGMNGALSEYQERAHIEDSWQGLQKDTVSSGDGISDETLVATLASGSRDAIAFIAKFGVELADVIQLGGHSLPRTHRESPRADGKPTPVGWDIISALRRHIDGLPKERLEIHLDAKVSAITTKQIEDADGPQVHATGVTYAGKDGTEHTIEADAVVLCTGGYGADSHGPGALLSKYAPTYKLLPTTNGAFATGDGVRLAAAAGASLVHMEHVQVHPTGFVDPSQPDNQVKFLAPEALRGCGGILLNAKGERFANELGRRDYLSDAIFAQNEKNRARQPDDPIVPTNAHIVLNAAAVQKFGQGSFDFYFRVKKFGQEVQGAAGLAKLLGVDTDVVVRTLQAYADAASGKQADAHGKTVFPVTFALDETFYVCTITPSIHYCMGGVRINASAQVLAEIQRPADASPATYAGEFLTPIIGLFGVGEVTGGLHGANRLGGNSLLECVVYGRIAGQWSAQTHRGSEPALLPDKFTALRLRSQRRIGTFSRIFTFDLPSVRHVAGMRVGQYISIRATVNGAEVVRYYSPISRTTDHGQIQLLVKCEDAGHMSVFLAALRPGEHIEFSGPLGNADLDPHKFSKMGLIAGGAGVSAVLQIVRHAMHAELTTEITLIYGAMDESELLFKDILLAKASSHPNFKVIFYLNNPPPGWTGGVGFITEAVLRETMPPPGDGVKLVLCGPPGMCKALKPVISGPLGYTPEQFFSFM